MKTTTAKKPVPTFDVSEFMERYGHVLEVAARRIHALVGRGQKYTPTLEVALWIAKDLPSLASRTWGRGLKTWRIVTMLSNAKFLGAYEGLNIRALRGKGLTTMDLPAKKSAGPVLRVIRGGKSRKRRSG